MSSLTEYWPLFLLGAVVALIALYVLLRPRQRVTLTDSAPVRPHMPARKPAEPRAMTEERGSKTLPFSIQSVRVDQKVSGASGSTDDLTRLKGVGPRFATELNQLGITRFEQLARFSPAQVDDLDQSLAAFRGRLARDHVVAQAEYLARGDIDGFEQRFGKL